MILFNVILVRYPFSDLSSSKFRPAVIVSTAHPSQDILITPLTSKIGSLLPGECVLSEWTAAGLNVSTAVKRGVYTVHESLVRKSQLASYHNSPLKLQVQKVDKYLTILPLRFEKEQLSCLLQR